jgi:hypothetical protein
MRVLRSPPSLLFQRVQGAILLGVMRPEREVDHSNPNSAQFKKTWIYTSNVFPQTSSQHSAQLSRGISLVLRIIYEYIR